MATTSAPQGDILSSLPDTDVLAELPDQNEDTVLLSGLPDQRDTSLEDGAFNALKSLLTPSSPKDIALAVDQGIASVPAALAGLGSVAETGMGAATLLQTQPDPMAAIEEMRGSASPVREALASTGYAQKAATDALEAAKSEEQQKLNKEGNAVEGFGENVGFMLTNPAYSADMVAQSLAPMVAGGALSKGFGAATRAEAIAAGAFGEGSVSAGGTAAQIQDNQGGKALTPEQAGLVLVSGIGVAGLSVLGGKVAAKLGIDDIDTLMAGNATVEAKRGIFQRVLYAAVQEGGFEELPQSAVEQIAQNLAEGKQWSEGVPKAMAQGLVAGGVMGGAVAFRGGPRGEAEALGEHELDKIDMQGHVDDKNLLPQTNIPAAEIPPATPNLLDAGNEIELDGFDALLQEQEQNPITPEYAAEAAAELAAEKQAEAQRAAMEAEAQKHPDAPRLGMDSQADTGASLLVSQNRAGEQDTNRVFLSDGSFDMKALAKQTVSIGAEGQVGKPLKSARLIPGKAVGVSLDADSELYPKAWREVAVASADFMLASLGLDKVKLVVTFGKLPDGKLSAITPLGNGTYALNPRNMTRFADSSQYNQVAQLAGAYSFAHEIGHIFALEALQGNMPEAHRLQLDTLASKALIPAELIAEQSVDVQGVLQEYNSRKARVLDGTMSAQEFLDTWMNPGKSGWGVQTKDGRQTFGQNMVGMFRNFDNMTALQFVQAGNMWDRLNPNEYLADQLALYAHDKKLLERSPMGVKAFFERALQTLRTFFASMKKEGIIKAGTSFTEFVDNFVQSGDVKAKVKRPQKSKPASEPLAKGAKEKAAKTPKIPSGLPEAFRMAPIIQAAKKVKSVGNALSGIEKQEVASAIATARKILVAQLQGVKQADPSAYKEMLELVNAGQLEEFRSIAEDYIGFEKVAQWKTLFDTSVDAGAIQWGFAATKFIEEKAPNKATPTEWRNLLNTWVSKNLIKQADVQFSGVLDLIAAKEQENKFGPGMKPLTKAEIVASMENASGPFTVRVLRGKETLKSGVRPDAFLAGGGNLDNYVEMHFLSTAELPMSHWNAHWPDDGTVNSGKILMWVRGEFRRDSQGRNAFVVHELQSDIAQGLRRAAPAAAATVDGKVLTLRDSEGGAVGVGYTPAPSKAFTPEEMIAGRIASNNTSYETLTKYQEKTGSMASTGVWLNQAMRAVQRYAADNGAGVVSITTEAMQTEVNGTSTISLTGNTLHAQLSKAHPAVHVEVFVKEDIAHALLQAKFLSGDIVKLTDELWMKAQSGQPVYMRPRAEGMKEMYGDAQGKGGKRGEDGSVAPAMIWKVLRKQNKGFEIAKDSMTEVVIPTPDSDGVTVMQGFVVQESWRGKPVTFFDTEIGTGPEFEKTVQELERSGLAGEGQNAARKLLSFSRRMTDAVTTLQQLAFSNKYVVGLQYYAQRAIEFQSYKSRLEIHATKVAHAWTRLGKEQAAHMRDFLQAEYESGEHWATLQKNAVGKNWEFVASERFVQKAQEFGLDETTLALALNVKQSMLFHLNSTENLLLNKALRRYTPQSKMAKVKVAEIMQTFEELRKQPYLPQTRFGDFGVMVYEYTGEQERLVHKEFFQTEEQRDTALLALQKKVGKTTHRVQAYNFREGMSRFGNVPPSLLSTVSQELELTEEQQMQLLAMLDVAREHKAVRQYSRELAKVTGRNRDMLRNYADFMQSDSNLLAKLRYNEEFVRGIQSVENDIALLDGAPVKKADYLSERAKLERVLRYMQKHRDYLISPQNEWTAIKSVVVLNQLWGVIKTAVANLTALTVVLADSTAHFGNRKGAAKMGGATVDATRVGMKGMAKLAKGLLKIPGHEADNILSPEESWAMQKAQVDGVLDQTFAAQLGDFSNAGVLQRLAGSRANNNWQQFKRMGLVPLHMVEVYTRYIAMLTKFRLYRESGLTREEAYQYASEETRLIMGDSTRINRAPFMRGKAANLTIYYGFTQLMMYLFSGAYERGYHERATQLSASGKPIHPRNSALGGMTTRLWLMFLFLGGAGGAPGAEDLRAVLRQIAQRIFGIDFDLEIEARKLVKQFNDSIDDSAQTLDPNLFMHGISHNIGGFDMSTSIGFGRVVPGLSTIADADATGMDTLLAMAGPLGSYAGNIFKAMTQDKPNLALQLAPAMPTIVKNNIEAYDWAQNGVKYHSGGKVTRDLDTGEIRELSTGELIAKGVGGFNPVVVSQNREMHYAQREAAAFWLEKKTQLMAGVAEARLSDDREAMADAKQAVTEYNQRCPTGMQITGETMKRSLQLRAKRGAYDERGIPLQKSQAPLAKEVKELF